jgi:ADP-ribose pyrophosphatase
MKNRRVLGQGRYLTLVDEDGWEYTTRIGVRGIAIIVAITADDELVLVEQPRIAVHRRVVELPAGMVGDEAGRSDESFADAARRELLEETGFEARDITPLAESPIAVGVCDELVSFFRADGLTRVGPGGGDDSEDITVHVVPMRELRAFMRAKLDAGLYVDAKTYAGLYLAGVKLP